MKLKSKKQLATSRAKKQILEKDNYTCQICGEKYRYLVKGNYVIKKGLSVYGYETGNPISLCSDCRKWARDVKKILTKKQLRELWIKKTGINACINVVKEDVSLIPPLKVKTLTAKDKEEVRKELERLTKRLRNKYGDGLEKYLARNMGDFIRIANRGSRAEYKKRKKTKTPNNYWNN